jgi:hypothetical protein
MYKGLHESDTNHKCIKGLHENDMLPFSLCNKKRLAIQHMKRPLFPTTLSIPSYNTGK